MQDSTVIQFVFATLSPTYTFYVTEEWIPFQETFEPKIQLFQLYFEKETFSDKEWTWSLVRFESDQVDAVVSFGLVYS